MKSLRSIWLAAALIALSSAAAAQGYNFGQTSAAGTSGQLQINAGSGAFGALTIGSGLLSSGGILSVTGFAPATNPQFGLTQMFTSSSGITAFAGGGQASATQLTTVVSWVSTVASTGDSVKLPAGTAGQIEIVADAGAACMAVFPTGTASTGDQINNLGFGVSIKVCPGQSVVFANFGGTKWQASASFTGTAGDIVNIGSTGAIQDSGVALPSFGYFATGTSAANLTGTLGAAQLPAPTASTIGGVDSLAAVSHKWINTISTAGLPSATQPACADISDAVATCNSLNAANLTGTLGAAQMPLGMTSTPIAGQVLVGNAGGTAFANQTVSGDVTLSSAGAVTVTKTNGVSFGGLATVTPGTGVATLLAGASSGTGGPAGTTSPTFTTPVLGAATATTLNGWTFGSVTATLNGTNAAVYQMPSVSATIPSISAANTWTANKQNFSTGKINFTSTGDLEFGGVGVGSGTALSTCSEAGTGSPTCSFTASNGSVTEKITLASSASATSITLTFPNAAANMYICDGYDLTTSTTWFHQTGGSITTAVLTYYTAAGVATNPGATDVIYVRCLSN